MNFSKLLNIRSDLPFKGSRDYLHGSDIYNWVAGIVESIPGVAAPIVLSFRHLARRQLEILSKAEFPHHPATVAEFSIQCESTAQRFLLIESGIVPQRRIPYDEDAIIGSCVIADYSITASAEPPSCTPIELCVAMTKKLHQAALPQEKRKWLFARIELSRFFRSKDMAGLEICVVQRVETHFTKSTVVTSDGPLGQIYFSILAA